MDTTLRYGIIGCGMMGQEHIRNIALLSKATVSAIYEPDAQMALVSGALAPNAVQVDSIETLLDRDDVNALLVASPNHLHAEQLGMIARRRALPLLMEKPLFTDPNGAAAMREAVAAYPAPLWVAMEYRYMPVIAAFIAEVRKMQATGDPIKMLSVREHRYPFLEKVGNWNRFTANSGGTLVEKCCHFFDLMRLVLGSEPVRLFASGAQDVNHLDETL